MDLVRQSEVSASQFGVLPLRFVWLGKARVRFKSSPYNSPVLFKTTAGRTGKPRSEDHFLRDLPFAASLQAQ